MKGKRIAAAFLSLVMAAGLAACGGGGAGSSAGSQAAPNSQAASSSAGSTAKKLTIWAWDDTFNVKAANEAKAAYAKIDPDVSVNVVSMAQNDIVAKLNTAFESGNVDGMPNIVLIEDYRIQNYLKSYPDALSDLSDVTKPEKFMAYKLKTMTQDGKVYGVPFDSGVACVFYRTDLIQKAGYKDADMQDLTWDKFIEIGKAVKAKTGKAMLSVDPSDLGLIRMMMQSAGKWYVDASGKADIAGNAALKEALTIYKKMQTEGITVTASGWDAGVAAVNGAKVATAVNGCWYASSIKKASDQSGKWAVASFPKMTNVANSVNATNCGGASWYVIDKVPGKDTAKDFLSKTFASDTALLDSL
ncbi:MAG: extracellular solute-binding protein, partial [Oscillospiraceae bacterium]|nr:extracellular solute-binding protein [Oscillospiraceae bacterium]